MENISINEEEFNKLDPENTVIVSSYSDITTHTLYEWVNDADTIERSGENLSNADTLRDFCSDDNMNADNWTLIGVNEYGELIKLHPTFELRKQ